MQKSKERPEKKQYRVTFKKTEAELKVDREILLDHLVDTLREFVSTEDEVLEFVAITDTRALNNIEKELGNTVEIVHRGHPNVHKNINSVFKRVCLAEVDRRNKSKNIS